MFFNKNKKNGLYKEFQENHKLLKIKKEQAENLYNSLFSIYSDENIKIKKYLDEDFVNKYHKEIKEIEEILNKDIYNILSKGSPTQQLEEIDKQYVIGEYDEVNQNYIGIKMEYSKTPDPILGLEPHLDKKGNPMKIKFSGYYSQDRRAINNGYTNNLYFDIDYNKNYYYLKIDNLEEIKPKIKSLKALELLLEDNDDLLRSVIENIAEKINYLNNIIEQFNFAKSKVENEDNNELSDFDEINDLMHKYAQDIL